jgi:hypothetical protein
VCVCVCVCACVVACVCVCVCKLWTNGFLEKLLLDTKFCISDFLNGRDILHIREKNCLPHAKICHISLICSDLMITKNWNFGKSLTSLISACKIRIIKIGDNMVNSTVWFEPSSLITSVAGGGDRDFNLYWILIYTDKASWPMRLHFIKAFSE